MIFLARGTGRAIEQGEGWEGTGSVKQVQCWQGTPFPPLDITNAEVGEKGFIGFLPLQPLKQGLQREKFGPS